MFPTRYFGGRPFAPRYFAKVGSTPTFQPAWAATSNKTTGALVQPA